MFTKKTILITLTILFNFNLSAQVDNNELKKENLKQYDNFTHKMDIIPGMWRPMFGSEQVAWISPSWESEEYVWLDFPETIWVEGKLIYLGHIDKRFPTLFPTEKSAPWRKTENGISYEQVLPNGLTFGGEVSKKEENIAALKLWIRNGSTKEFKEVKLQTCTFLNGIKEFNEETDSNKFIHTPKKGWQPMLDTINSTPIPNGIRVGWLDGKQISDLPVIVVKSKIEGHLLGMTWFDATYSFIGNPAHPCAHADPAFDNLKPGESQTIHGELIFFEGTLEEFEVMFRQRMKNNSVKSKD